MRVKRKLLKAVLYICCTIFLLSGLIYFFQERLIFHPEKLAKDYPFRFAQPFEELNIPVEEHISLNGLRFTTASAKGPVIYLHGNAGSLASWGQVARAYTDFNYDVFIYDYRGYGKSEGFIKSEAQLYEDNQKVYEYLGRYQYKKTVIIGYSIGTGMAAQLATTHPPDLLILQAPFYSLTDLVQHTCPILPSFLLKYKFETYKMLENCPFPVVLFHGDQDEIIYYQSSEKLLSVINRGPPDYLKRTKS